MIQQEQKLREILELVDNLSDDFGADCESALISGNVKLILTITIGGACTLLENQSSKYKKNFLLLLRRILSCADEALYKALSSPNKESHDVEIVSKIRGMIQDIIIEIDLRRGVRHARAKQFTT
jgi:4'-phosphopantetheinyl transferase EntD